MRLQRRPLDLVSKTQVSWFFNLETNKSIFGEILNLNTLENIVLASIHSP